MFRRLLTYQLVVDLVVGGFFMVFSLWSAWSGGGITDVIVLVVLGVSLVFRRLSPALALILAWLGALLQVGLGTLQALGFLRSVLGPPTVPAFADLAILAVLFATAAYGGRALRWIGLASAMLGALVATAYLLLAPNIPFNQSNLQRLSTAFHSGIFILFGSLAVLGLSWTLGLLTRTWRRGRASRLAQAEAERDVIVEQERNRIARDMHDVVAHSLAVVIAQADGARYAMENSPEAVDGALGTISATAREALGDVRMLLTQLRHSVGDGPQPALGDLDKLVEQLVDSGLDVHRADVGNPKTLASGQQLALYRIVQEALTNALRHGDASLPVALGFDWSDPVTVTITNSLGDAGPVQDGHGLAGMRERAALVGGTLSAGRSANLWVVSARVPS